MVKKTKKTMQESFNELDELIEKFWQDVFKLDRQLDNALKELCTVVGKASIKIDKLDKWLSRFKWLNK